MSLDEIQIRLLTDLKCALLEIRTENDYWATVSEVFKWGFPPNLEGKDLPIAMIRPMADQMESQKMSGGTRLTDRDLAFVVLMVTDGRTLGDPDWPSDEAIRMGGAINRAILQDPRRSDQAIDTVIDRFEYFPEKFASFDASVAAFCSIRYRHRFADTKVITP